MQATPAIVGCTWKQTPGTGLEGGQGEKQVRQVVLAARTSLTVTFAVIFGVGVGVRTAQRAPLARFRMFQARPCARPASLARSAAAQERRRASCARPTRSQWRAAATALPARWLHPRQQAAPRPVTASATRAHSRRAGVARSASQAATQTRRALQTAQVVLLARIKTRQDRPRAQRALDYRMPVLQWRVMQFRTAPATQATRDRLISPNAQRVFLANTRTPWETAVAQTAQQTPTLKPWPLTIRWVSLFCCSWPSGSTSSSADSIVVAELMLAMPVGGVISGGERQTVYVCLYNASRVPGALPPPTLLVRIRKLHVQARD